MNRDARVVVLNNEIVYSYWRNKIDSSKFTTTSTSNGSALDFTPLPKKNQNIIIEYTKKLNLLTAAYYVTFFQNIFSFQANFIKYYENQLLRYILSIFFYNSYLGNSNKRAGL
jgi:hypothetical protein